MKVVIYDDYNLDFEEDITEQEIYAQIDDDWEYAQDLLKTLDKQADHFLMVGSCGLWNGRVNGGKFLDDLLDFTKYLYDNTIITLDTKTGIIEIETMHHDGTNYYTIKPITKLGERFYESWLYEDKHAEIKFVEEMHDKLWNTHGLTRKFDFKPVVHMRGVW